MEKNVKELFDLNTPLNVLPIGIFWKNTLGVYRGCNEAFASLMGFLNKDEILNKKDTELLWKAHAEKLSNLDKEVIQFQKSRGLDIEVKLKNEKNVYSIIERPLQNEKNEVNGVLGFVSIISEKKDEIDPLNDLENIISSLPGSVYWKDREGIYRGCNKGILKLIGYSSVHEVIGKTDYDFGTNISKEFADTIHNTDQEIIASGLSILNLEELPFSDDEGRICNLLTNKRPLFDEKSNIIGIIGVSIDVTNLIEIREKLNAAKVRAEKSAKDALENLERIIGFMPGSVYWKDRNGVYIGCNDAMANMLGLSKSDVLGKTDYDFLKIIGPASAIEAFAEVDREVMESGIPILNHEEPPFHFGDGQTINQLSNKVPIKDDEGNIIGVLGISIDITEKKKLEAEIREMRVREERLKVLSSMGGMIAHELKTPLTGVQLGIASLKEYLPILIEIYKEWSKGREELPISEMRFSVLQKTCDDLALSLAGMENTIDTILAGFRPLDRSKLDLISLDEIIQTFLDSYPLTDNEKTLITVKFISNKKISGNPQVILHVLTNLLKNALYVIKEVGKGEITIWTTESENKISLHFKDTAKGIPKDKFDKIFEPFYTTKSSATSIGMGLYFCKMALEKTGAQISCKSVEEEYTMFTLVLPKGASEVADLA